MGGAYRPPTVAQPATLAHGTLSVGGCLLHVYCPQMRRDLAERIALTLVGALAAGGVAVLRGTLEASAVAPAITLLGALLCLAALLVVWVAFAVREVQRGRVPICRLIILAVGSLSAPAVLWKEVAIVGEESFPSLGWIWYVILLAASLTVAATAMSALAFLARAFRRS